MELRDPTLTARRRGEVRTLVFGSPSYFQRRARPKHPDELAQHNCVVCLTVGDAETWLFRIACRRRLVKVSGRVRTDSTRKPLRRRPDPGRETRRRTGAAARCCG